eukprot:5432042-Prymnesium_polylepis.1
MSLLLAHSAATPHVAANCVWGASDNDVRCSSARYAWRYPNCSLYQRRDRRPIPCQGVPQDDACTYRGANATDRPMAASWHVHVFFPSVNCTNCSALFTTERENFTYAGAMELRRELAARLNEWAENIAGAPLPNPIDVERAARDPNYNQCIDDFNIVAGAPVNFHAEPCIFEVDAVKKLGPFTDPKSGLGYPNYSFFIPGAVWMPGLMRVVNSWLQALAGGPYGAYDVLVHPNTGCEVRDHMEEASITWLGDAHPLLPQIFSCRALGCNQACPSRKPVRPFEPPASCGGLSKGWAREG